MSYFILFMVFIAFYLEEQIPAYHASLEESNGWFDLAYRQKPNWLAVAWIAP
jgi:hypothetical protein